MAMVVLMAIDAPDGTPMDAPAAVALWEIFTGIEDAEQAIAYARHVVDRPTP